MSTESNQELSQRMVAVLAASVGVIAANLYYAQPLVALISRSLGLSAEVAGFVVTFTQIGYGLGVLCLVPLGDIVENRKLILTMISLAVVGILSLAFVTAPIPYFIAAFATGLGCAGVQVIVPYAAHFASEANRGRVIGSVSSGLMIGIMLSRPIASFLTDLISWHAVFVLSAILMVGIGGVLYFRLPPKAPHANGVHYFSLLRSMLSLLRTQPLLRQRAFYQACLFGAFCFYWTTMPLLLGSPEFHFSQTMIAVFALIGFAGAIAAPMAGRAADRGWIPQATLVSILGVAAAFLLTDIFSLGSLSSIIALAIGAIVLDAGTSANLVLGQRVVFGLGPEIRGRLNALYIAITFIGGGLGSAVGAWAYAKGGWNFSSRIGLLLPILALMAMMTERFKFRRPHEVTK